MPHCRSGTPSWLPSLRTSRRPAVTPAFADYLYLAFTNAAAFSPTDVMPLSRWAKLAMTLQSVVSIVTVALIVARAVNILK